MPDISEAVAQAHAVHFSDLMQRQWLKLISKDQQMALSSIDADLENLRWSWRYWLERRDAARIRMYSNSFWRVYELRGWYKTGMELFSEAVTALKPVLSEVEAAELPALANTKKVDPSEPETENVYADALAKQAYFLAQLGYADEGLRRVQESVNILRRLGRYDELAFPLEILRYCAGYVEDPLQATLIDTSEVEFRKGRDGQWERAFITGWPSRGTVLSGEYELARRQVEESLQLFEQLGDVLATIWPRTELGNIAVVQGSIAEARKHYQEVLHVARTTSFNMAVIKASRYLGNIATILGDFQEAREYLIASLRLADELGLKRDVVSALYDIATVEAAAGDKRAAVRLLALIELHPFSDQTRTFSYWSQDPVVRFRELAEVLLAQLQDEMTPDAFEIALASGRALELDTAVLELLSG